MNITEEFRNQILIAMPELSQADADKIAGTQGCSSMTVYSHWKRLKNLDGEFSPIMQAIASLAASYKKKAERDHKKLLRLQQQLSAA